MKKIYYKIYSSNEFIQDVQTTFENMKFENVRLITQRQWINLEQELKNVENLLISEESRKRYSHYKNELETIDDHISDGIRIRSKCEW